MTRTPDFDYTGQRFGLLTANEPARENGYSGWTCTCDCGAPRFAITSDLRRGFATTCGSRECRMRWRDMRRGAGAGPVRPRIEPAKVVALPVLYPPGVVRPMTRGDCVDGPRPCPWASCRHNLTVDVDRRGIVTERDPDTLADTCALDVADRGEHVLEEVGDLMGLTRERIRKIEEPALHALGRRAPELGVAIRAIVAERGSPHEHMSPTGGTVGEDDPEPAPEQDETLERWQHAAWRAYERRVAERARTVEPEAAE